MQPPPSFFLYLLWDFQPAFNCKGTEAACDSAPCAVDAGRCIWAQAALVPLDFVSL